MSKFYDVSSDTQDTFFKVFNKKTFPLSIKFQFVGAEKQKSLIKISIVTGYGFRAVVDIGYHIPKEAVQSYFEISNLVIKNASYPLPFTYMFNGQPILTLI